MLERGETIAERCLLASSAAQTLSCVPLRMTPGQRNKGEGQNGQLMKGVAPAASNAAQLLSTPCHSFATLCYSCPSLAYVL